VIAIHLPDLDHFFALFATQALAFPSLRPSLLYDDYLAAGARNRESGSIAN